MNKFTKLLCLLLTLTMVLPLFPAAVSAEAQYIYSIQNDYIKYSINTKTGGFSVETLDGNPQKKLDDKIPLLYKEDEDRSSGTSFTTVRIDGEDYVFGRSYGFFGISTELSVPEVSDEGRLITVDWKIKDYVVTQQVAVSAAADNDLTGNVGISYTVKNTGKSSGNVGIRVLLDVALDSTVDAPYLVKDTGAMEDIIRTEREYLKEDENFPSQIRGLDSLENPSKALYAFTKTFNNEASQVDRFVIGHWRNLANTRYEYTPDKFCDFTNYSNKHFSPDAAFAYYWNEAPLAEGESRVAEILYGVGNFSASVEDEGIGLDMSIDNKIRLNEKGDGYVNDGKFDVTVVVDNSVTDAKAFEKVNIALSFDDGISSNDTYMFQQFDNIEIGDVKTLKFHLQVDKQQVITAKTVGVTLTGTQNIDESKSRVVTLNTYRSLIVPSVSGGLPQIKINSITPEIVFTEGEKTLTVSGDLTPFSAIKGTDGWKMFLYHSTTGDKIEIDKDKVAFIDNAYTQLTFTTDKELVVGKYEVGFEFTNTQLADGFGADYVKLGKTFEVSNNPIYRAKTYGIMALVRYNRTDYAFVPFPNQDEYNNFLDGLGRNGGNYSETNGYSDINGNSIPPFKSKEGMNNTEKLEVTDQEIILIMRGSFKEATDESGNKYYQASKDDGDIIINEILTYTGSKPLTIKEDNGIYTVSGDGKLAVINSVDVWPGQWHYQVNKGTLTTLDDEHVYGLAENLKNPLELKLDGVGYMVQSLGGFLIDIKYGVMTAERPVANDRTLIYGIGFGGSISIPISIPSSDKDATDKTKTDAAENTIKKADENDDDIDYSEALQNLFNEDAAANDGKMVNANDTKPKNTKPQSDFKKDTNLDSGLLYAAINDVRFGQKADKNAEGAVEITDTGFIGIDATLSIGLPKDVLGSLISNAPGIYASLTINTIDHFYMLEAGLDIKMIQCEGVLSFMMTDVKDVEVVVPDSIQFYIRDGLQIPIVPPALYMTGLGGGIDGLADTIGGEFSKLPPITLLLFTRLEVVELMVGDFNLSISLTGITFDGDLSINTVAISKPASGGTGNGGGGTNNGGTNNGGTNNGGTNNGGTNNGGTNNGSTNNGSTNNGSTNNGSANNGGTNNGGTNNGGTNNGSTNNGSTNNGSTNNGSANNGSANNGNNTVTQGINSAKGSEKNPANNNKFAQTMLDTLKSPINIQYGASARWIDPICFKGYGNVTVIGGLLSGGVTITITDESFYGYANLSLCIPDDIPLVGGYELAGLEAAISDKFLGANIKIIGIKLGFIYYWDGDFSFGSGINLMGIDAVDYPEYNTRAVFGTNLRKLLRENASGVQLFAASDSVSYAFNVAGLDSALIIIPFEGYELPTENDFEITNPDGQKIPLVADDGNGNGTYRIQSIDDEKFIYVSVTDKNLLKSGNWTVTQKTDKLTINTFNIYAADNIPELTNISYTRGNDKSAYDMDISWSLDSSSVGGGYLDVYISEDKDILDKIKDSNTSDFEPISRIELENTEPGTKTIQIPDGMDSGTYYVAAMLTNKAGGMSTAISATPFEFVNKKLPKPIKSASLKYAGNGDIYVDVEDADNPDYTHYVVEVAAEDGSTLSNNINEYALGEDIYIGKEANLAPGSKYYVNVKTLKSEGDNKFYYGTDTVQSDTITMPEIDKPVLQSVTTNVKGNVTGEKTLEVIYTFDRPVWMYTKINEDTLNATDFKETWTLSHELKDGDYVVDFTAYGENKDSVTGADFPNIENAKMGFTVDTSAPALSIKKSVFETLAGDNDEKITSQFGSNVVFADSEGNFTIEGVTDYSATLTADGNAVETGNNGTFTYSGKLAEGEVSKTVTLKAVDKASNESELAVYVIIKDQPVIESVKVLVDGKAVEKNEEGEAVLTVKTGDRITLSLMGYAADGTEIPISDPVWDFLYEKNLSEFNDGILVPRGVGTTAIKGGVSNGSVVLMGTSDQVDLLTEDYIVLNIIPGSEGNGGSDGNGGSGGGIARKMYTVKVEETENGVVKVSQDSVYSGNSLTITSTPNEGYEVDEIIVNGVNYGSNQITTIPAVKENLNISVKFRVKWDNPFIDVTESDWFYGYVRWAHENGIMKGTADNMFSPDEALTRAMLVTILWRAEGEPAGGESGFADVAADSYYATAVAWAQANGIVKGYSETEFAPDDNILREQIAAIMYRYAAYKGYDVNIGKDVDLSSYEDAQSISEYAVPAMQYAVGSGLIKGKTDTVIDPVGNATRAESATILQRFVDANK